jgi:SAM domain (Sterile alpha motif)
VLYIFYSHSYNRTAQQLDIPMDLETSSAMARRFKNKPFNSLVGRSGRGGAWGSISRVFARSKNRNKAASVQSCDEFQWNPLNEESYAEKIKLLREASGMPIELWRSPQIAAWLEIGLGMPKDCIRFCSENVKSGKVLLELTDAELESGLGATHPMHRKKLRLAIEEQRRPDLIRYSLIGSLGHS